MLGLLGCLFLICDAFRANKLRLEGALLSLAWRERMNCAAGKEKYRDEIILRSNTLDYILYFAGCHSHPARTM